MADPAEVAPTVLSAFGLREQALLYPGRTIPGTGVRGTEADALDRLVAALAGRRALLVLDNCEHLVAAAATLADRVLAGCPGMRILATSREPLNIGGETLWPVGPLELPPDRAAPERVAVDWAAPGGDRRQGAGRTPRSRCSSSGPGPLARGFLSRPRTRRRCTGSAGRSMGCRWRSSWRPRGCGA